MAVMIGVDPHKGSHTAVALDDREQPLGELRVRSAANQAARLMAWAAPFTERTWAIEGAGWQRGRATRTIPTTPDRSPSPRCAQRRFLVSASRITRR